MEAAWGPAQGYDINTPFNRSKVLFAALFDPIIFRATKMGLLVLFAAGGCTLNIYTICTACTILINCNMYILINKLINNLFNKLIKIMYNFNANIISRLIFGKRYILFSILL